jgi:hypothetical protein
MTTGLLAENAAVIDKFHALIQDESGPCIHALQMQGTCRAMKNKYVVSLFLLAMGLGIAFVVTAANVASSAVN